VKPRIVITGGPGSGKTKFVDRLKREPALAEFTFFDELARQLLEQDPSYRDDRNRFHLEIFRRQVAREDALGDRPFITDRGTVDAFAFHPEIFDRLGTSLAEQYRRYTAVIQLQSTASLGQAYYKTDSIRLEPIEDALIIQDAISRAWRDHPDYEFIIASPDIEEKYGDFLRTILRLANKMQKQDR
jgi:predicted ATPase